MTASTEKISDMVVREGDVVNRSVVLDGTADSPDSVRVSVHRNAVLDLSLIVLPGQNCDLDVTVDLEGEGAEVHLSGIYICPGEETVRIKTVVNHKVPHCVSRQLFKGIAGGTARTDFYGLIVVSQDAQKTEAYQENHNLLMSDTARMDTKPQLEIYADDVKCSHGATIGRLNEEEQFYMRSRGIPEKEARTLQMVSFLAPVISHIRDEKIRTEVAEITESAISDMAV